MIVETSVLDQLLALVQPFVSFVLMLSACLFFALSWLPKLMRVLSASDHASPSSLPVASRPIERWPSVAVLERRDDGTPFPPVPVAPDDRPLWPDLDGEV